MPVNNHPEDTPPNSSNTTFDYNSKSFSKLLKKFIGLRKVAHEDTLLFIFVADPVKTYAEEVDRPMILQFMVGEMVISNDDPRVSDDDYNVTLFGVAAQKPFYGEISQVGIETGGLFNWKSETRAYAASGGGGGGTIAISTEH